MSRTNLLAIVLFAGLALASAAAQQSDQSQIGQMFDQLKYKVLGRNNSPIHEHNFQGENGPQGGEDSDLTGVNVGQQMDSYGQQQQFAFATGSSCPSLELSDCSGMQIHLKIDNSRQHQTFRGLRFANKSGLVISQYINTSNDCPVPQINMRNTSGTKIFITDDSPSNNNSNLQGNGNRCPNISMRDCSGMDISIRIDNVNCPVPQIPGSTNSGSQDTAITMKDCSGIKIFMRVNSS